MKRIIITILALTVLAAVSIAAVAESTEFAIEPASQGETSEDTAENTAAEDATESTDDTALQEAEDAYRAAKLQARLTEYEDELKSMVEAGTLTQEQADLLLAQAKEQASLKNGECPNCGYEFENSGNGRGGHGMKGGYGFGGRH